MTATLPSSLPMCRSPLDGSQRAVVVSVGVRSAAASGRSGRSVSVARSALRREVPLSAPELFEHTKQVSAAVLRGRARVAVEGIQFDDEPTVVAGLTYGPHDVAE